MTRQRYRPMLAQKANAPFTDPNWIFEVKWDGFRAIAYVDKSVSVRSRHQKELIGGFPELEELNEQQRGLILDGEIVILEKGKVNFQALLERSTASATEIVRKAARTPAVYVVFDILEKDGKPLISLPLTRRKAILAETLKESGHVIQAEYVEEKGEAYYEAVLQKGLEGIIAKKKNSLYKPGIRSSNWLKIKKLQTCDCVILGFTQGSGVRKNTFGALLLGLYDRQGDLVYVGKVGTGFSQETLKQLSNEFKRLVTNEVPLDIDIASETTWLKPIIVCEVGYQVITKDKRLRMPRFLRLRIDKQPKDCTTNQLYSESLREYKSKRDFKRTAEPEGKAKESHGGTIFVVQEHHSRRLHYDFRLERGGVLKSWAVPKGIPTSADEKRLAVETEDHPIEYAEFEGEIPKGEYGAGQVIIWDSGTFETKVWDEKMVEVILHGDRLKGRYVLVPLKRAGEKNWLMLKTKE